MVDANLIQDLILVRVAFRKSEKCLGFHVFYVLAINVDRHFIPSLSPATSSRFLHILREILQIMLAGQFYDF